jgi:kinesin family protein 5
LTTLGKVIVALTDKKSSHVPYRESKLTRILSESLGGNSKTCLIITCSPHPYNDAETLSTLRFGARARNIKNAPKVNREYTVAELKKLLEVAEERIKSGES